MNKDNVEIISLQRTVFDAKKTHPIASIYFHFWDVDILNVSIIMKIPLHLTQCASYIGYSINAKHVCVSMYVL